MLITFSQNAAICTLNGSSTLAGGFTDSRGLIMQLQAIAGKGTMTEDDIIKLICAGGKAMDVGIKALYQSTAQPMLRFFVYKGVSGDDAKDVLQETFIKIVRNVGSCNGDGAAKAWIWQVARNCLIDHQRKQLAGGNLESAKAAKAAITEAANAAALHDAETSLEHGVKITRLPYVGDISKSIEKIPISDGVASTVSDKQWEHLENTVHDHKDILCSTASIDECVAVGLGEFCKLEPERTLVLMLQMDGISIDEIGVRIGRTMAATKEYLSQCKKKIQPFIAHCTELLVN
jgi:RNA polymerase sigma factor (sigma-70 family)